MKKEDGIKNMFKNYLFYQKMIPYLDQRIEVLEYKLEGVSSIPFDKQHGSTNREHAEMMKHELREEIELYLQFKEMCQKSTSVLRMMFDKLTPEERKTISDLYIFESKGFDEKSKEKDITSGGLHKQVLKTLGGMI